MAWGTYRRFAPLKASLTESDRQEMQQNVECHTIYWNSHAHRVSKPSLDFLTCLFVIWNFQTSQILFGAGLYGQCRGQKDNSGNQGRTMAILKVLSTTLDPRL
jgi:hypothetical protein